MQKVSWMKIRFTLQALAIAMMVAWPVALTAAPLTLSTKPMYLGNTALPNVVFTIDDSGSMAWEYMPDQIVYQDYVNRDIEMCKQGRFCNKGEPPFHAYHVNTVYYNPAITYSPAVNADGSSKGDIGSPWTSVANDAFGVESGSTNITDEFRDKEWCGDIPYSYTVTQTPLTVFDGSYELNSSGNRSIQQYGDNIWARFDSGHGLSTGDVINVSSGGGVGCDGSYQGTNITVTRSNSSWFYYVDQGSGTGDRRCKIERPGGPITKTATRNTCLRNGIDTDNPFEYRTAPTGEDPVVHGLPSDPYTSNSNVDTNPYYYAMLPREYCSDKNLTTCIASPVATGAYTYPAYVRWCDTLAHADAAAGTNTGCQGSLVKGSYEKPRYAKFYREDIKPTTTTYGNITVSGNIIVDRSGRTDCASAPTCTYAEEMTNIANWHTYYRTRMNTMKTAAGKAFAQLSGDNLRIGFARINKGSTSNFDNTGWNSPGAMVRGVRKFIGTDKSNWFTELYNTDASGGTALRLASKYVGQYYSISDSAGPWGTYPGNGSSTELSSAHPSCRQSYHILSSDGYWNGSSPNLGDSDADDSDGTDGPVISSPTTYDNIAELPYKDTGSVNSLADVAMYFWENDLRTNLDNTVPTNPIDDAFWQHVVTFTLGFGVKGTLDPDVDLQNIIDGYATWPTASSNQIDDMWHAAVNGRGSFFSVENPTQLTDSLTAVFQDISNRTSSAASVAIDTAVTSTNRAVFQARFYSGDWTGTLKAFPLNLDTGVLGAESWDAQTQVSAQDPYTERFIATWDTTGTPSGTPFRWADLTAAQKTALNKDSAGTTDSRGSERVDFVRGTTGISGFRPRVTGILGDIVHSSPIYVAAPPRAYSGTYETFKTANASRTPVIYVGANDGMLHAFEAASGDELFAYVPNAIIDQLPKLTTSGYVHQYFVDGPNTVEDIQDSGGNWKTALVGTLGSGGKAVYALDITDPVLSGASVAAKETDLASKVLWEYAEADLGYVHGEVAVAKMANGEWAAIFGNGYNNTGTGKAAVYVVNADTGALIKKFSVGGGTAGTPSGMAAPLPVDVNGDSVVDYIYAGDLEGKVWKFDVTSSGTGSWDSAFNTSGVPQPLFVATDDSGSAQPITSRVEVGRHPTGSGYMVYFGTGKYLENGDNASTGQNTQAFYGIWDKDTSTVPFASHAGTVFDRDFLLEQTIDYQLTAAETGGRPARVTSDNGIVWHYATGNPAGSPITTYLGWYLDLENANLTPPQTDPAATDANEGERLVTNPILIAGRIIFATFLPPVDVCSGGGDSWIMELDADNGSRLIDSVWDINMDTSVDGGDFVTVGGVDYQVSGTASTVGAVASPTVVSLPGGQRQIKLLSGTTGMVETVHEAPGDAARGRQSWIRLQ